MKFIVRILAEFEAEDEEAAQQFMLDQVKNGMQINCMVELAIMPTDKEMQEQENVSFKDLLNNLNSGDMTKN